MDMGVGISSPGSIEENNRQNALLARATTTIDQLANGNTGAQRLGELLDWLAYFTREHFGFQRRLLNECDQQRKYLLDRMKVHGEFRRRLAQLCIDTMRHDPSVPERLCALCHDLLADAQAQQEVLAEIVREASVGPKLRRKPRQGELATLATQIFEARVPESANETTTTH
jgi:hypothetical protein